MEDNLYIAPKSEFYTLQIKDKIDGEIFTYEDKLENLLELKQKFNQERCSFIIIGADIYLYES